MSLFAQQIQQLAKAKPAEQQRPLNKGAARSVAIGEANKKTVLSALKKAGKRLKVCEISEMTGLTWENCRIICQRLSQAETPLVVRSGEHGSIRYELKKDAKKP